MKILFATHGFPPQQNGGVELCVQELASSLAGRGHEVSVLSGSLLPSNDHKRAVLLPEEQRGAHGQSLRVMRLARNDLYFDHWHKSHSASAARAFRELLRELAPDVVHVMHWIRLSRDLVTVAAREGIPALITLHDAFVSCPIVFRVRPDTQQACDVPVGPHPCIACAGKLAPRTPWVPQEAAFLMLAERQRDLARELELARALIVPSLSHARGLERTLGRPSGSLACEVIEPRGRQSGLSPRPLRVTDAASLQLVSWSQIARHKGVDVLLEGFLAARAALAGRVELSLEIHGEPADPQFAAQLRERALGAAVRWCGAYHQGELGSRVDPSAAVFVSATRAQESYGSTVDEAAQLGLALLLPDAPVFLERLGRAAHYFASGQAQSLCAQIVRLAHEPELVRDAQIAAREWAVHLPTCELIADRHEAVYERAVETGAPTVPPAAWFEERLANESTAQWDSALSQRTRAELGL